MSGGPCGLIPAAAIPSKIRSEGVEVSAGLPEVDDPPAIIDRPRGVKEEPCRWRAIGVGVIVSLVELFFSDPSKLDADADGHPQPLFP
jgi:hypothetical protein